MRLIMLIASLILFGLALSYYTKAVADKTERQMLHDLYRKGLKCERIAKTSKMIQSN